MEIPGSVEDTVYNIVREILIKSEKWVTEKHHVSLKCIFSLSPESEYEGTVTTGLAEIIVI